MSSLSITCSFCKKVFLREKKQNTENRKLYKASYCSLKCLAISKRKRLTVICNNAKCAKVFEKRRKEITHNNYCSRSCAASVNNAKFPKNPGLKKQCIVCSMVFTSREKYCSFQCKSRGLMLSKEEIIDKIKDFYSMHCRLPFKHEFLHAKSARKRFGSWNNAIKAAGFPPNPVMFSIKYTAKDGHVCDSLSEKIIDDWLYRKGLTHSRNIAYPEKPNLTVDFVVNEIWIEFFGLYGQHQHYDLLHNEKIALAKKYNIKLIKLYPKHLFPTNTLNELLTILEP